MRTYIPAAPQEAKFKFHLASFAVEFSKVISKAKKVAFEMAFGILLANDSPLMT